MTPLEYEKAVARALRSLGWESNLTPATADFGADVIARCGSETLVVQCKSYAPTNYVRFDAIKDASFAQQHFEGTIAAVVFAGKVTKQARFAAQKHGIFLLTLPELKIGCALDRTEKGRIYKERMATEQAAEARRLNRVKLLEAAKSTIAAEESWCQYDAGMPEWLNVRQKWHIGFGIRLLIAAAIFCELIAFKAGWLAISLSATAIWIYFGNFAPKIPSYLNKPKIPRPQQGDLVQASRFLSEVASAKSVGRVTVTCPNCATLCGVPAGRKLQVTCPTCFRIFERDLRAGG